MSRGKYKFYTDGANKIVAVSSYAGKSVRGVAKCDPRDHFDEEAGRNLAEARCALKIADKRFFRAQREYAKAQANVDAANARLNKMLHYMHDSQAAAMAARENLRVIEQEL